MSSKSKRRVTVETGNAVSDDAEKRKPSVFERLGPGGGQRKYSEYESEREKKCRPFLMTGECPYGTTCKYKHVQLSSKSRSREDDTSPENLRLKLKSSQSERSSDKRRDSDTESHETPSRSRREKETEAGDRQDRSSSHQRRDKEMKIRSQVVVKKSENQDSDDSGDDSESNWFNSLDYKKEPELEQKRQQLQRELSQLEEVENITVQKKPPASQSGSDSSPERGRSSKRLSSPHDKRSTSPSGRGKKEKKKHHTKSPPDLPVKDKKPASPGPDKPRDHKRKHETEEEGHKKHKKNKKERKRSLSPLPETRGKKKDKWAEEPEMAVSRSHTESTSGSRSHTMSQSKRSRSSSSDSSLSPPRSKDSKGKAKAKAKKKKSRGGRADSDSDESHTKSKKWLSPLKKTLKLKKAKASSSLGDSKVEEERVKQRSASPKSHRRGERRDLLAEDPMPPSRSHDSRRDADMPRSRGHSAEKRDKKHKGRRSESPPLQVERSGSSKRGESSRDAGYSRKGRQSESPAMQTDRSSKRGDSSRDISYDHRKQDQRSSDRGESRKQVSDDRSKRASSPPRQAEMYSPSQLDRESPVREPVRQQSQTSRGRHGNLASDRDLPREEDRRAQDRDRGRGEKFDSRSSGTSQDRSGQDRYNRRSNGDNFDQYSQDRGRFDSDRNRWEYREGRGQEASSDREQRGRRAEHFERGLSQRDQARGDGLVRDASYDRQDGGRVAGSRDGRDNARDNEGRDRSRDAPRDRGDNRDGRDRDGRGAIVEGNKYNSGSFGPDGQRRSSQWEAGSRSGEWGSDRGDLPRDLAGGRLEERGRVPGGNGSVGSGSSGGRLYRDDGSDRRGRDLSADARPPMEGARLDRGDSRMERGDSRLDRADSRIDRNDSRLDRGDSRSEGRMDRGDGRMERGDSRVERGDRGLGRGEGRLERGDRIDRGDSRVERGDSRLDRGDSQLDHRRGDQPVGAVDQRGFRQGRGGASGSNDGRGGVRGVDNRSPVDNRSFDFDRRSGSLREGASGRPGERDGRLDRDRDREPLGMVGLPARDRYNPATEFRRDDLGYRDNPPDVVGLRDRRSDDRFVGLEGRDVPPRGDRRFDDPRDDRMQGRGQDDDRQGRDRMMPRRGGHYDYGRGAGPDSRTPDLPSNQRRGPLLPTPPQEEPARRGGRGDPYDRDAPRGGRDVRDDRGRRDRDADFGPELGHGGREMSRDSSRDQLWERDSSKEGKAVGRDGRRGRGTPSDDLLETDRNRDGDRPDSQRRDRDRSPRRDGDKLKDDFEPSRKHMDKKDDLERADDGKDGGARDRLDAIDVRSTRSADDVRELAGQRSRREEDAPGGPGMVKGVRDRDSQSDGKRSPARSHGKDQSPHRICGHRQPGRARSLSPKQRRLTPPPSSAAGRDGSPSPAKPRSPSRRGADSGPFLLSKGVRQERSRTPLGTKRRLDEDLRSPASTRSKDDTKSPASKRPREDSRSPVRRSSRHPSPAGSHHSRGSHSSMEPRRRQGLSQRDPEGRFFGGREDRDSPARRDRDRERDRDSPAWRERERERDRDSPARRDRDREKDTGKMEKTNDSSKGDSDKGKRGRSPPRPQGRGSDMPDRSRKRWRGEHVHPAVELAWQAGFEPADIESKLGEVMDKFRQTQLRSGSRNLAAQKVVLDKRYERERLISESDDLLIMYDCKRQSMLDWFIRKDRKRNLTHFEEDAQNCVKIWSAVSSPKYQPYCAMLSRHTQILAAAIRRFLDGSWSETEGGDGTDKESYKQKSGSGDQSRSGEVSGDAADSGRLDNTRTLSGSSGPGSVDGGKPGRQGRVDNFHSSEDRAVQDGRPNRGDDSFSRSEARAGVPSEGMERAETPSNQDSANDSKDTSLGKMLYDDDYEKISSDESDFEAEEGGEKQTQNIVSVLDIDWASLAKEPAPKQTTGSLLKRFHPASVFSQIGISRALAGPTLFDKVKAICEEGVPVEEAKDSSQDKENVEEAEDATEVKKVEQDSKKVSKMDTRLCSDIPVLHMAAVRQKRERTNLLRNLGPYRRALCARRDLEIRRQLCKVDKVYEQPAVFPAHVMDADLCKLSIQLFRQGRDFIERKDSECDGKMELAI